MSLQELIRREQLPIPKALKAEKAEKAKVGEKEAIIAMILIKNYIFFFLVLRQLV